MQRIALPYHADLTFYFQHFLDLPWPILFDSCEKGAFDWFSAAPPRTLSLQRDLQLIDSSKPNPVPIKQADDFIAYIKVLQASICCQPIDSNLPFTQGLMGYISYDFGQWQHNQSIQRDSDFQCDLARLAHYDWAVINDHQQQQCWLVIDQQHVLFDQISQRLHIESKSKSKSSTNIELHWQALTSQPHYFSNIERIHNYILAGDCYQINYTQSWQSPFNAQQAFDLYLQTKQQCPTPYSGYFQQEGEALLSHSPEQFLHIKHNLIRTQPIKGTIERGRNAQQDAKNKQALLASDKDRAENVMIVDLLRNDLSKVSQPNSVRCPKICALETYANVHHLVSEVIGKLDSHYDQWDAFFAAFPGGSITGAPKKRAMQIINQLEDQQRNLYCGSMVAMNQDGQLHSNILIRSYIVLGDYIRCYAGGGIVIDSQAAAEYAESYHKAGPLLKNTDLFT